MSIKKISNDAKADILKGIDRYFISPLIKFSRFSGPSQDSEEFEKLSKIEEEKFRFLSEIVSDGSNSVVDLTNATPLIYRGDHHYFLGSVFDQVEKFYAIALFQNNFYGIKDFYDDEQIRLLILEHVDSERRKFERLKAKHDKLHSSELKYERTPIPEDVRIAVWRRDQGKCAKCNSREYLEYDHIVPVSKGGSNTARNIELLCEKCNREKSNNIA